MFLMSFHPERIPLPINPFLPLKRLVPLLQTAL
jgi:hypothetical protein